MSTYFTISPGAKLYKSKWNSDIQDYEKTDVTDELIFHLMGQCSIEDGVTLRDIFLLAKQNIEFLEPLINNWIEELIEEGLSETNEPALDIDYLELYHSFYIFDKEISGFSFPSFHGVGVAKEDDFFYKKGDKVNYGIDFSPANELIDLPIKLSKTTNLEISKNKYQEYTTEEYTLLGILYGVFWELSFCGSPENRDIKKLELMKIMGRVEDGHEPVYPIEDIFKEKDTEND